MSPKATEQNVNELLRLADGRYEFYDRLAQNKDTQNTYYMFCLFVYGFFAGCSLGLLLHHFLYSQMITKYWGTAWQIPLSSVGGILALLVLTSLLAPLAPAKRICGMAVSETINEL